MWENTAYCDQFFCLTPPALIFTTQYLYKSLHHLQWAPHVVVKYVLMIMWWTVPLMTTPHHRSPIFARAPRLTEEHWHPDFIRHILPAAGWYVNKVQHVTAAHFSFQPHERPPSLYTWALMLCLSSLSDRSDPQQQCPCSSQPITASGSITSRYATVCVCVCMLVPRLVHTHWGQHDHF